MTTVTDFSFLSQAYLKRDFDVGRCIMKICKDREKLPKRKTIEKRRLRERDPEAAAKRAKIDNDKRKIRKERQLSSIDYSIDSADDSSTEH